MERGFVLGRVLGIEIRIVSSWLILFFLIAWSFTFGVYPALFPRFSITTQLVLGVTTTLLFFGSVLVHELAHSILAKHYGIEINRITLFLFGGAAEIADEPSGPKQEFLIAAVGPATSLAIAGIFGSVWYLGAISGIAALLAIGMVLAVVNTALAIFNLLPGFPLDGGRILRSIIWHFSKDLKKATQVAARAGQAVAFLLMGLGLLRLFSGLLLGGIWLILIGWFLYQAAQFSYTQTILRLALKDVKLKEIMIDNPPVVAPATTAGEIAESVLRHGLYYFPVIEGSKVIGVVSAEDARRQTEDTPAREFMEVNVNWPKSDDPAARAVPLFRQTGIDSLPVVDSFGNLAGIITRQRIRDYTFTKI